MSPEEQVKKGIALPLMEDFYTIQGEGYHAGKPAWFLRVGGCDVGCRWCDVKESWKPDIWPVTPVEEILKRVENCPAKTVVVTGGEPTLYNLSLLTSGLKKMGFSTFLETSGAHPLTGSFDWICLSPKKYSPPLPEIYSRADEYKVIIHEEADFEWAEKSIARLRKECKRYLQPEWSRFDAMMPAIVEYCKNNPSWEISLQIHKYMRIP
ncbi:MAG: 7-carboxy-7-deazaguanine synthase QueE [Bacteroidales bacterium]